MISFDLLPYLFIFLIGSCALYINTKKTNDIVFFVLFVFSAVRYDVGFDFMAYSELIQEGEGFNLIRIEPIERLLIMISHNYCPQFIFMVNSFVIVYFTKWALERKSVNVSISTMAFLCFPLMFTNSFSIIRFWSALAIVFYASTLISDKKYIKFFFLVVLAMGFHKASIIAILYIPLYLVEIPLSINIALLVGSFVGGEFVLTKLLEGVLPDALFADQVMRYATHEGSDGLSKIPYLYLIIDVYFLLKSSRLRIICKESYCWITIYNIGVSLIFLLSFQTTLATRLCRPFLIYFLFLIPWLIGYKTKQVKIKNSKLRLQVFNIVCLILFIYLLSIHNESLGRSQYLPYQVFFI